MQRTRDVKSRVTTFIHNRFTSATSVSTHAPICLAWILRHGNERHIVNAYTDNVSFSIAARGGIRDI